MGRLLYEKLSITTTGVAGSATGFATSTKPIIGVLRAIYFDYHASAPATTDVAIGTGVDVSGTTTATTIPTRTIHNRADSATDGRVGLESSSLYIEESLDYITARVSQCDALTNAVIVYIIYEDMSG